MEDASRLSEELHRDAHALLEASGLLRRLEVFGEVVVTGSYRYDLMTVPDVDLCLVNPRAGLELASETAHDLIAQGFWRGVSCDDFVQFPRDDLPGGLYLGLKRPFRGRFWKVDVWLLTDASRDAEFNEAMSRLTDEQRAAIMTIKQWRHEAHLVSLPSKLIYYAVLQGRAHDVESFHRLIEDEWPVT